MSGDRGERATRGDGFPREAALTSTDARAPALGHTRTSADARTSVVVITHNRRDELLRTLDRLVQLPERPPVFVTDNASSDGTADAVARHHPGVRLLRSERNLGAVGRNLAIRHVETPYVAFCDDDSWWAPGSLGRAADLLDRCRGLAVVGARIVVEPDGQEDPVVRELRESPLDGPDWLPGPALGSFLAAASVLRTEAFRAVGGFSPRLWLGGEEELLATDLMAAGWWLAYAGDGRNGAGGGGEEEGGEGGENRENREEREGREGREAFDGGQLTVHHAPSVLRDPTKRRVDGLRNTLWFCWLRRPLPAAARRTWHLARTVPRDLPSLRAFARAAAGLPWVARERRVVPADVERRLRLLETAQRHSTARRYVG
jgi:hypothetical protein